MKITFNDGQELQIQQVAEQTDGALLIKTISAEEEQLKTLFSDAVATKRMSVSERDADMGTADYVRKENLFTGTETFKGQGKRGPD